MKWMPPRSIKLDEYLKLFLSIPVGKAMVFDSNTVINSNKVRLAFRKLDAQGKLPKNFRLIQRGKNSSLVIYVLNKEGYSG